MRTENMNISYRKFRRMHGRIVLLTIFGLLIAGEPTDLLFHITVTIKFSKEVFS